jgi:hypothetical protein
MHCTRCGQENDDQARFCRSCGAALHKPVQQRGIQRWIRDKRILACIGLIGGILALVGVFAPWATHPVYIESESVNISAWDTITARDIWWGVGLPPNIGYEVWAGLALHGAVLALVGTLSALAAPKSKVPWAILGLGGVLAIAGSAWGLSDIIINGGIAGTLNTGYGLYLTLAGGILALIGSVRSGAVFQTPIRVPSIQRGVAGNKIGVGIGGIAGILALVGIFGPWAAARDYNASISAWDAITGLRTGDNAPLYQVWAGLALHGAILVLVGALSTVAAPKSKVPWGILGAGVVMVMAGCARGLSDIRAGSVNGLSGIGYGLYLTLVGAILGLIGLWRLRDSLRSHGRPESESK